MIDKRCPWCNGVHPAHVTRTDDGCAEWRCSGCGGLWTVKVDQPGEAFAFWPGDVADAADDSAVTTD